MKNVSGEFSDTVMVEPMGLDRYRSSKQLTRRGKRNQPTANSREKEEKLKQPPVKIPVEIPDTGQALLFWRRLKANHITKDTFKKKP